MRWNLSSRRGQQRHKTLIHILSRHHLWDIHCSDADGILYVSISKAGAQSYKVAIQDKFDAPKLTHLDQEGRVSVFVSRVRGVSVRRHRLHTCAGSAQTKCTTYVARDYSRLPCPQSTRTEMVLQRRDIVRPLQG